MENNIETKYNKLIVVLSVAIPLVVALLFGVNLRKLGYDVQPLSFLPPIYATINGLTAVVLVAAVIAIKNGNRKFPFFHAELFFLNRYFYSPKPNPVSYNEELLLFSERKGKCF